MLNEVKSSTMSSKQRTFRDKYRNQIQGWYNGLLHVSIIYATGFLLLAYFFGLKNFSTFTFKNFT